jgi:hypothetical protein
MLPIKHKSIFKSRWIALLWAGGILWSACEFVGAQPGGNEAASNGQLDANAADLQAAVNALGGSSADPQTRSH